MIARLAVSLCLLLAAACALAPPAPTTPSQALAVAEVEYSAAKRTAAEMADAGVLSGARLERVAALFRDADQAREWARAAWDAGDPRDLDAGLALMTQALIQLRAELAQEAPR